MAFLQQLSEHPSSLPDTEENVIRRVNWGDQSALEDLFRNYYDGLCKFVSGFTNSATDVEDMVQDIFVNIWRNRSSWHPKGSIRSYLFKAAHNQAINCLKARQSKDTVRIMDDALPSDLSTDPVEKMIDKDMSASVDRAIQKLPEKCRTAFVLNRQEGLSYTEVADVLGISVKTVENQIAHALKELRKDLRDLL